MAGWVAGALAVYSIYSAEKQADAMSGAMGQQTALLQRQVEMAEEQWARFQEVYGPLEDSIVAEAMEEPDYAGAAGRATTDVRKAYGTAEESRRREMGRYGLDPSMGRSTSMIDKGKRSEALAEVGARNLARQTEEDKSWAKKIAAASLGRGLPADAAMMMSSAASQYGQQAGVYGQQAQAGYQAGGYWFGRGLDYWSQDNGSTNYSGMSGVNEGSQQDTQLAEQNQGF